MKKNKKYKHMNTNKSMHSEMCPLCQNPTQRTVRTAHLSELVHHSMATFTDSYLFLILLKFVSFLLQFFRYFLILISVVDYAVSEHLLRVCFESDKQTVACDSSVLADSSCQTGFLLLRVSGRMHCSRELSSNLNCRS